MTNPDELEELKRAADNLKRGVEQQGKKVVSLREEWRDAMERNGFRQMIRNIPLRG